MLQIHANRGPDNQGPPVPTSVEGIEDGLKHEKITIFVPPSFFF